ncbi:MAG TPA: hypothetical protein VKW76_06880 [Candidatus Binatia bacterium]|nr:hypothetical protein [Candidatus Binatia bacterium]
MSCCARDVDVYGSGHALTTEEVAAALTRALAEAVTVAVAAAVLAALARVVVTRPATCTRCGAECIVVASLTETRISTLQ